MILINLLPPELRKRHVGSVSPVFFAAIGGGVLNLVLLASWAYLKFKVVPALEEEVGAKTTILEQKTVDADRVIAKKATINDFETRRNYIVSLINRKVYWARTLDEFATQLTPGATPETPPWTVEGFDVRVQDISITELGGEKRAGGAPEDVRFGFRWRYKIVGNQRDRSGDYVRSFFKTIETGRFWREQAFEGKPEDRYLGDKPVWNDKIAKVIVDGSLDWVRHKPVVEQKRKAPAAVPPPAAQGN
jgi:hypothetical protein